MSQFDALLSRGFDVMTATMGVTLTYNQLESKCIPSSQPVTREQRDSGFFEAGMQIVELKRTEKVRLNLVADSVVKVAGKPMKVKTIDDDEADPCVRLTLRPHRE